MKRYEIYTILSPRLSKEEVEAMDKELESALAGENFKIERREVKIQQPLAYPINHHRRGSTIWAEVTTEAESADVTTAVGKKFFGNDRILRWVAFARKAPTREAGEGEGVISELRRQRRARMVEPSPVQEPVVAPQPIEKSKVDVEEIDRKIEELLK